MALRVHRVHHAHEVFVHAGALVSAIALVLISAM